MRIFLDTNIVLEYLFDRKYSDIVGRIFEEIELGKWECFISSGSFYTLTYLIDNNLKDRGFTNPKRLSQLRSSLLELISLLHICDVTQNDFAVAVKDEAFKDIEDSYQYQAALATCCHVLLTINKKDFQKANQDHIKILSPQEFLSEFL